MRVILPCAVLVSVLVQTGQAPAHTTHPDAQWFPDATLGLFLHWDPASVKGQNIGWSVIPGRKIAARKTPFTPDEVARIVRESDYNLDGKPWPITPREYWSWAKDFRPTQYDPDKWLKAAKAAGFEYAVLTTKHHNGFALWPSRFGGFNTTNYMDGRDLVKDFVEACRRNDMKVGLYFSGPDWHFDQDWNNFLYHGNEHPELPALDADLRPRTLTHTAAETAAHQKAYAEMVKGQIEELLTRYGKIDVLWFDGKPAVPNADKLITAERIRELQPGIVINPRLHGSGDYVTYERNLTLASKATGWAEFCNTWTNNWSYVPQPFRSNGFVLGQLAQSRSLGVNYLLGIGPMANGELEPEAYANMAVVSEWMKANGAAIKQARPLADTESASVPATAAGSTRYLFALRKFRDNGMYDKDMLPPADETLTLSGVTKPVSVTLLRDGSPVAFTYANGTVSVALQASKRTKLVDVVKIVL
ncbi:MAG TPA: alpha-L-fucosidase [Vicinamibacterales bacterium]|nr:alpha-L-fucosidase [Vicinamibacterales bacterium]